MAKKLVYNYTFDASAQTIKITGLYTLRTLILITNVTDQQIIYNFADSNAGGTVSYDSTNDETTITLEYDTTTMSDGDELQILADDGGDTKIDAGESLVDPVHKFRVSTPQNLIDTDFEYGLQPTKWETIELVDNIPSVYVRGSGTTLPNISSIQTTSNSELINVTTGIEHDLNRGDPIDVQGTSSVTANGKYIVSAVISTTRFQYKAKAPQSGNNEIVTAYTTIIPGAFFTGSELKFDETGIITDNAANSNLTITTDYRHGLVAGSSLYLRNTISEKQVVMSNQPLDTAPDGSSYINIATDSIYFQNHGFVDGDALIIEPDRVTNPSAALPATQLRYLPPTTSSLACRQAYAGIVAGAEAVTTAMGGTGSGLGPKPMRIYLEQNSGYSQAYYANGGFRFIDNYPQSFYYMDYVDSTTHETYQVLDSFGSNLGEYRYSGAIPNSSIYTGNPFNVGYYFSRYSGSGPSTLSGHIWQASTPYSHGTYTDFIVKVRTYDDAVNAIGNSNADRFGIVKSTGNYQNYVAANRALYGYGTTYDTRNYANAGNNWHYKWTFKRILNYTVRTGRRNYTATGMYYIEFILANTSYANPSSTFYTTGTSGAPVQVSQPVQTLTVVSTYHNQSVQGSMFQLLQSSQHSDMRGTSGTLISGSTVVSTLVSNVIDKLEYATFSNTTGQNTVYALVLNDNRLQFEDADGKVFDFTGVQNNVHTPIIVSSLNPTQGGNDDYYDIDSVTNNTITIATDYQVKPRELTLNANDVIYHTDEKWYFRTPNTADHTFITGQKVTFTLTTGTVPGGLTSGSEYYVIDNGPKYFTLASSYDDALQGTSVVTGAGTGSFTVKTFTINGRTGGQGLISIDADNLLITGTNTKFGSTYKVGDLFIGVGFGDTINPYHTGTIESIVSDTILKVDSYSGVSTNSTRYFTDTALNVRTDGTSIHRPFDGGVEMTAGTSPDCTIVRQTRKYFRYQSGKGIQCSMAINFNPYRLAQSATGSGTAVTITTEYPHGLSTGDSIKVRGASDSAYNGSFTVTGATTFTFSYTAGSSVTSADPDGFIEYVIDGYSNAGIRAGLFDFQNGFFFEYDGSDLYAVRRSSVQQLQGTVSATYESNIIVGTNTKFNTNLTAGDMIVIRGQSHKVTSVISDTEIHVQPYYRGTTNSGIIVTKTEDVKVAQSNWNIDKADGTGPSGYILDISTIQMVYMDYSWYGAGKIRFGFKDTYGHVKYMHEFIHNNRLNEAYMRSGNVPARYEAFNSSAGATFVPSLFHWGTSVIMDGGFDDDDSYLFTATGNSLTFTNGDAETSTTTADSSIESFRSGRFGNRYRDYYLRLRFANNQASKFSAGIPLYYESATGQDDLDGEPVSFTQYSSGGFDVYIYLSSGFSEPTAQNIPSGSTINIGAPVVGTSDVDLTGLIPLISIRLAPSADNNVIGAVGERDIINRMQLKLKELGVSASHDTEITVLLNSSVSNLDYQNVGTPSLSQYVPHKIGDTVDEGTVIYRFRASGGSVDLTGKRLSSSNAFDLSSLIDLGNSILGGDGVFPNGPDIITICATVINTQEIDANNAYQIASRLSWAESQA